MTELRDERYVILRHSHYEDILIDYCVNQNKYPLGPAIWHCESVERYNRNPPGNPAWLFVKIVSNPKAAFDYIFEAEKPLMEAAEAIANSRSVGNGSLSNRYQILKRDGFKCQLCGKSADDGVKLEIDHKLPKSLGGGDTVDNLWTLCFDCNRGKSNRDSNV